MRQWFTNSNRLIPGSYVDHYGQCKDLGTGVRYDYSTTLMLTDPCDMRGPFETGKAAVEDAKAWRNEGKRSDIYLILVVDTEVRHCMKFNDDGPIVEDVEKE